MKNPVLDRRAVLKAGVATAALGAGATLRPGKARAADPGQEFTYEIVRSEAEWRNLLSEAEFRILREGDTELPNTSPLTEETAAGIYCCRGCELTIYDSVWKVPLKVGYVFFSHSRPDTVLTSIDGEPAYGDAAANRLFEPMIEVHCRRCGSHLGHILVVQEKLVHCINGTSLLFRADAA